MPTVPIFGGPQSVSQLLNRGCRVSMVEDSFATRLTQNFGNTTKAEQRHKLWRPTNGFTGFVTGGDVFSSTLTPPFLTDGSGVGNCIAAFSARDPWNAAGVAGIVGYTPKSSYEVQFNTTASDGSRIPRRLYLNNGFAETWADGNRLTGKTLTARVGYIAVANGPPDGFLRVIAFTPDTATTYGWDGTPDSTGIIPCIAATPTFRTLDISIPPTTLNDSSKLGMDVLSPPWSASHTFASSGSIFVHCFLRIFDPAANGMEIDSCANAGLYFDRFLGSTYCTAANNALHLQSVQAQVRWYSLVRNDQSFGDVPHLIANLNTAITRDIAAGVTMFVVECPHTNPADDAWIQAAKAALWAYVQTRNDTFFINLADGLGAAGPTNANYLDDGLHLNGIGCAAAAAKEWDYIRTHANEAAITDVRANTVYGEQDTGTLSGYIAGGTHYCSWSDVQGLLGPGNAAVYVDPDDQQDANSIASMQEQAMSEGDAKVDAYMMASGVVVPASTDPNFRFIRYAAARYSAVATSRFRGELSDKGRPFQPYAFLIAEADAMLDRLITTLTIEEPSTGPTGPVSNPVTIFPSNRRVLGMPLRYY